MSCDHSCSNAPFVHHDGQLHSVCYLIQTMCPNAYGFAGNGQCIQTAADATAGCCRNECLLPQIQNALSSSLGPINPNPSTRVVRRSPATHLTPVTHSTPATHSTPRAPPSSGDQIEVHVRHVANDDVDSLSNDADQVKRAAGDTWDALTGLFTG